MTTLTITLTDETMAALATKAAANGMKPEELVGKTVQQLLAAPERPFNEIADYIFRKNAELYRRLAK